MNLNRLQMHFEEELLVWTIFCITQLNKSLQQGLNLIDHQIFADLLFQNVEWSIAVSNNVLFVNSRSRLLFNYKQTSIQ